MESLQNFKFTTIQFKCFYGFLKKTSRYFRRLYEIDKEYWFLNELIVVLLDRFKIVLEYLKNCTTILKISKKNQWRFLNFYKY